MCYIVETGTQLRWQIAAPPCQTSAELRFVIHPDSDVDLLCFPNADLVFVLKEVAERRPIALFFNTNSIHGHSLGNGLRANCPCRGPFRIQGYR